MPIKNVKRLLVNAQEKQQEKLLWERWLAIYPYMEIGRFEFISFIDYKNKLLDKKFKTTDITKEEIEEDILKVKALYERR